MAVTDKPWDGSASRYDTAAQFCDACLINMNTGDRKNWTKDACLLPIREPNGDTNRNALGAAAARINQVKAPPDVKKKAARALMSAYRSAKMDIPDILKRIAG